MAILKCKMCGGDIELSADRTFGTCDSCGSTMTFPKVDDEQRANMFNRGNHFRRTGEFDKALAVYERIVQEDENDAEAHWCCALCRFGIEYVEDPNTFEYLPTCHRASFDSFLEDVDYLAALEHSDGITKRQYQKDAAKIAEVQRGILATSQNEEPFDVFICYKESEADNTRTRDSLLAQEIYYQLTEQGRRVFFSRITLEDKAGTEYEPYIFAALNSAKVMIVVTTSAEHVNAVWVKNEWSRFLKLMEKDKSKHLIPCYKGIDAYDMPKEFHRLQGQDMGKVGAVQDLLRGIEKILPRKSDKPAESTQSMVQQIVQNGGPNVAALLDRGNMALEDSEWEKAREYYDQVLNMDSRCAEAYLGLALADERLHKAEEIGELADRSRLTKLENNTNYTKALRFSSEKELEKLNELRNLALPRIKTAEEALEQKRREEAEAAERKHREELEIEERKRKKREFCVAAVQRRLIACGNVQTIGLLVNGSVLAAGRNYDHECDVDSWTNVVAVSAGNIHTIGLRADGLVLAAGSYDYGKCNVDGWTNVVDIAAGGSHTVGLRADGTVLAVGNNDYDKCRTEGWTDVIAVDAGNNHTVGLRADGSVLAVGNNDSGQCEVNDWSGIVAVAAGGNHTVGLRSDGSVIAVGSNASGQCEVNGWSDIIAVAAGSNHTVGLLPDGSVIAVGNNVHGQCIMVKAMSDIIAVAAGHSHTVGLRADGTVIAVGSNEYGQCDVDGWKLFNNIDTLAEERQTIEEERRQSKSERLTKEHDALLTKLSNLNGMFSGKRRKEIEARLAEIDAELKKLNRKYD